MRQVSVTKALVVASALKLSALLPRRTCAGVVDNTPPWSDPLTKWMTLSA